MTQRLLVISPVRNEAAHLKQVALAIAAQTRPPDAWVVVDDHSTDDTRDVLERLAPQLPFMTIVSAATGVADDAKDRLAVAADAQAFNTGLLSVDWQGFTHISKLDGDTELPRRYFELLLEQFVLNSRLGLAGGVRVERIGRHDSFERVPIRHHVPGALKCYTLECFQAIDGMRERLAWDTIDEVYARMRGYETRAFPELIARHHRPWGSADGTLRGRSRLGLCAYLAHYPLSWVVLRAFKTARMRPWGLSGIAYLGGYLGAVARSTPRISDPEFHRFFRRELRGRALNALIPLRSPRGSLRPLAGRDG